jgi:hypothetical protein
LSPVVAAVNGSTTSDSSSTGDSGNGADIGSDNSGVGPWASVLPSRATALANRGDAANIHIVRSITKPFEGRDRPNWYGWTTSSGRQLASDELAWFIRHAAPGSCPSYLYLFQDETQTDRSGYNAGAVIFDGDLQVCVGSVIDGPMYDFQPA